MPGYKKKSGIRKRSRKAYSRRKSSMPMMRKVTDDLKCHISLTDNLLYNNLTSRALCLVNWAGDAGGTDSTFRLPNSAEFTRNFARYRWYKVHSLKITVRPLLPMYEFDTARTGGIISLAMASSPV